MHNIRLKWLFLLVFTLITSSCMQNDSLNQVNETILDIKMKHAPDKRVAIFNLTPVLNGNKILLYGETNIEEGVVELMKELEKQQFIVENEVTLLPNKELGEKIYGIVNISVANVRSKAKHPAELATQSLMGTCLNVLKKENGWYQVQTPDLYISWVDNDGIVLVNEEELQTWKQAEKVIVTSPYHISSPRN